jgi:hypothetical protein
MLGRDGKITQIEAIAGGYTSWVKGLMNESFALALQGAEDV